MHANSQKLLNLFLATDTHGQLLDKTLILLV